MNFRTIMTGSAKTNLREIEDYIAKDLANPSAAKNVRSAILYSIRRLTFSPYHQLVDVEPYKSKGIRSYPVGNYIVFYMVDETTHTVYILKIAHSKQSLENRMKGI